MNEDKIRAMAYQIWQQEGCPEGREQEHWAQAVKACSSPKCCAKAKSSVTAKPAAKKTVVKKAVAIAKKAVSKKK